MNTEQIDSIKKKFEKEFPDMQVSINMNKKGGICEVPIHGQLKDGKEDIWSFFLPHLQDAYKRGHQDGYHDLETYIDQYCQTK